MFTFGDESSQTQKQKRKDGKMENKSENDKLKQVSFLRDVEQATSPDLIFFFSEQLLWQTLLADAFLWMQTRT